MCSAVIGVLTVDKRETVFAVVVAVGQSKFNTEFRTVGAIIYNVIKAVVSGFHIEKIFKTFC